MSASFRPTSIDTILPTAGGAGRRPGPRSPARRGPTVPAPSASPASSLSSSASTDPAGTPIESRLATLERLAARIAAESRRVRLASSTGDDRAFADDGGDAGAFPSPDQPTDGQDDTADGFDAGWADPGSDRGGRDSGADDGADGGVDDGAGDGQGDDGATGERAAGDGRARLPLDRRLSLSEAHAAGLHPDYREVTAAFPALLARDPELRAVTLGHDHPAEFVYQVCAHALDHATAARARAVADYRDRLDAAVRAQNGQPPQGDGVKPPRSVARARSSGGRAINGDFGPTPLDVIFARKS